MGYDINRFVKEVDEELLCPICTMVLENGVQSQHCEHTYCDACIKEWLSINKICPVDRRELKLEEIKPTPRILKNLLNRLEIKCDFEANGCQTITRLENLRSHSDVCLFNPDLKIKCSKECGLEMTQKDYEHHNCLSQLSSLVLAQQKQINKLEKALRALNQKHLWISPNGLLVNHNIIECHKESASNTKYKDFVYGNQFAQTISPLSEHSCSVDMEIIELSAMAIVLASNYKSHNSLGRNDIELYGYANNGIVFVQRKSETYTQEKMAPKWVVEDIITIGIIFNKNKDPISDEITAYIKRNNVLIHEKKFKKDEIGLYPTVYTTAVGAKLILNNN